LAAKNFFEKHEGATMAIPYKNDESDYLASGGVHPGIFTSSGAVAAYGNNSS